MPGREGSGAGSRVDAFEQEFNSWFSQMGWSFEAYDCALAAWAECRTRFMETSAQVNERDQLRADLAQARAKVQDLEGIDRTVDRICEMIDAAGINHVGCHQPEEWVGRALDDLAQARARIEKQHAVVEAAKEALIILAGLHHGTTWELAPYIKAELARVVPLLTDALEAAQADDA